MSSSSMCQQSAIKKGGPLEEIKIVIIQLKWNAQGKGMILIVFETGLQDRRRAIKRGSQVSNLIASLWRAQTFAYLASSSFQVLIWFFSQLGFGACRDLHDKPKFLENGFWFENLLCSRVGNIIGLSLWKVAHFPMCGNLTLFMVLNISNKTGFT